MLIPTTYGAALLALALALFLWGLWTNTARMDRKHRFELYAFDFALGLLFTALVLAFTLGNRSGGNSFTFEDNLTVAGKRNMMQGVSAGAIFALGHLLTLAGMALAGISTALPVSAAMALLVGVLLQLFDRSPQSPELVFAGAGVALLVLVVAALAQSATAKATPVKRGMHANWKAFVLSAVGGFVLGAYPPVVEWCRAGEIGLGAYAIVVFFGIGCLLMTPLVNLYFLNLPVQGAPLPVSAFFKATIKQHLLGFSGGAMWGMGLLALYLARSASFAGAPKALSIQGVGIASAALGALCGLTIWGESAASGKAKGMLFGAAVLVGVAGALLYLGA